MLIHLGSECSVECLVWVNVVVRKGWSKTPAYAEQCVYILCCKVSYSIQCCRFAQNKRLLVSLSSRTNLHQKTIIAEFID